MKKGKVCYIRPDEGWNIAESKYRLNNHNNLKKFFTKVYNKKLRQYFKKQIKNNL